jgi:hypothetical protein
MNSPVKIGASMALIFSLVRYISYLVNPDVSDISGFVLTNIFLLLAAVFVGSYMQKRIQTEDTNALYDIKTGLKAGLPYAVLVAFFLYAFYAWINPEFLTHEIAEASVLVDKMINDPVQLAELRDSNPDFELKGKEEIRTILMGNPKSIYSAGATSTLALLGMLVLSTFYSLLTTILFRTIYKPR